MRDNEQDAAVLDQLREVGSDLTKSHQVEFFLYFPSEKAAQEAGRELQTEGFSVDVHKVPQSWWQGLFGRDKWSCVAEKAVVPERQTIFDLSRKMDILATRLSGNYDGWGCPVVR